MVTGVIPSVFTFHWRFPLKPLLLALSFTPFLRPLLRIHPLRVSPQASSPLSQAFSVLTVPWNTRNLQKTLMLSRSRASLVAQLVKNLPVMQETWVQSLGWDDPLEKGKAIHSSILAWKIPWLRVMTWLSDFHFTSLLQCINSASWIVTNVPQDVSHAKC